MSDQDQLKEHEYDGIQEFDNRLPNWWLWTLYGAIVFAVVYWMYFHTWRFGDLATAQYDREVSVFAAAQLARMEGQEVTDETLVLMSKVPDRVQAGSQIFQSLCVTCHLADASGDVGPNLTDDYWLHGGQPLDILKTVTEGVPDKGMVAWAPKIGPQRVQDVVSYILTIRGMNLPGKAPEGEPYHESGSSL